MDVLLEFEEMNVVDSWLTYEFEPYFSRHFKGMLTTMFDYITANDPFTAINNKLAEMAAFKAYLSTNPNGFKPNAHLGQISKVNEAFKTIEDRIFQHLSGLTLPIEKFTVQTSTTQFNFEPVAMKTTVSTTVDNYRVAKSPDNAIVVLPESISTTPPVLIVSPTGDTTTAVTPRATGTEAIVSQSPKPESSSGGGLLLGLGIAATVLFFALKNKEKKDQK